MWWLSFAAGSGLMGLCIVALAQTAPGTLRRSIYCLPNRYFIGIAALHSAWLVYRWLYSSPFNLFIFLNLPITAPQSVIQEALQARGSQTLLESVDGLLAKLEDPHARICYARFGHLALTACAYCRTEAAYAQYAFTETLRQYGIEAVFARLLTAGWTKKDRWRRMTLGSIITLSMVEGIAVVPAIVHSLRDDETMVNDMWWRRRQIVFFLLPIVLIILPTHSSSDPTKAAAAALAKHAFRLGVVRNMNEAIFNEEVITLTEDATPPLLFDAEEIAELKGAMSGFNARRATE